MAPNQYPALADRGGATPIELAGRGLPEVGGTADRVANVAVTIVPLLLVGFAAWKAWDGALRWPDLVAFALTYVPIGFGVTVGFHRLLSHRSFKTGRALRGLLAGLGSAAVEGPVIEWVAYHRKHHALSDQAGDPHSPHVGHGHGLRGALRGLFHAHLGWVWFSSEPAEEGRYAKDLLADPLIRAIDRGFLLCVLAGLAFPFGVGVALTGTLAGGLTALLWGGAVRIFLCHQLTFCINSLCHFFGRRPYATGDESRNLAWLAIPTFGEAWHNNHHAFPTCARHGVEHREIDLSGLVISGLERLGLAWDVVEIRPDRRQAKLAAADG